MNKAPNKKSKVPLFLFIIGCFAIFVYFAIIGSMVIIPLILKEDMVIPIENVKTISVILGPFMGFLIGYFFNSGGIE
jgi:hypothetical protein